MTDFRKRLGNGELLLGQMVLELFTPGIAPMLDACGLDFVIFDMEHGRCNVELLAEMLASSRGSGIFPMARVPDVSFAPLSLVLDLGAKGIMVPRVETREEAEHIVRQVKYAPEGKRGVALGVAHDLYRAGSPDYFKKANEEIAVIVMLESVKAIENVDEILSVPGIDIAWVGHYDLTSSMGIAAQFEHPRLLEAMETLLASCRRHRVTAGFLPPTAESARYWIGRGFRVISLASDIGVFMDGIRRFKAAVRDGGKA